MDKGIAKSSFGQFLAPLNQDSIQQIVDCYGGDKYVKKLTVWSYLKIMLQAQLEKKKGLRAVHKMLLNKHLQSEMGFESISTSQLSRTSERLNPEIFRDIYIHLGSVVQKAMSHQRQRFGHMAPVMLIDSSTISLCLQKYPWAKHLRTKAGIKLHQRIVFVDKDSVYPDKVVIAPAKPDDRSQMTPLIDEEGVIYVFDRGYEDYGKFDGFCEDKIGFATRLRSGAIIDVVEEMPVEAGSPIRRDTKVILGSRAKRMKHVLRRIESTDSQGNRIVIITNLLNVSAEEIGDLYRYRWKIELFFKYMKQHLKVTEFYGTSDKRCRHKFTLP